MRLLVTGAGGLLGGRLAALLARSFETVAVVRHAPAPPDLASVHLDLADETQLDATLARARPEAIVHCAALADADRCESHPELARLVNVEIPRRLARLCQRRGLRLIALSTDLVFEGRRAGSTERDVPRPILLYGRTKLEGEAAILEETPDAAIVRVPLVLGRGHGPRSTASEAVARRIRAGEVVRLFVDQHRSPTDPESVADGVARLLAGGQAGRFHLGGPERLSRFELGQRVARVLGLPDDRLVPIRQAEAPVGLPRPADVSLDSSRARRELAWEPRSLDEAIREGRLSGGEEAT